MKREDSLLINIARKNWIVVNTSEVEIQLVSHNNVFDTVLVTPSSQGVAIRTQEDSPWAFDNKLLRLNAYSNASYEVILTSEIGNLSCSLNASSPRYSIKSYGSFILLKADSADSVNLVLGGFTYHRPPDYYGSVEIDISVTATDSDNINRSGETASFLIFVEPVDDAPEEVVRSSSPYLNGKDVRDARCSYSSLMRWMSMTCYL